MTSSDADNIKAIFDFADEQSGARVVPLDGADHVLLIDRQDERCVETIDVERFMATPNRAHGTTQLDTPASFVDYTNRVAPATFDLYADIDARQVVAVLNPQRCDGPTWQDHRAVLTLGRHPSWRRWLDVDGKLLTQEQFAVHVQECSGDIAEPPAMDLLEIAETLTLNVGAKVSSAVRLRDGQRHLVFDETVDAKAGYEREVDVPERLSLHVPIFEGCDPEEITVRLLYRSRDGVKFLIQIVDRADRERQAFTEAVDLIGAELESAPLYGKPA